MNSLDTRAARRNRACCRCRVRKVKCDGQRPSCSLCQSLRVSCFYEADRRQSSRISKENFQLMGEKVASLEQTLAALSERSVVRNSSSPDGSAQQRSPPKSRGTSEIIGLDPIETSHSQRQMSFVSQQLSTPIDEAQLSEIQVHALVQSETGISVHGPASAFHVPTSVRSGPSLPSAAAESPSSVTRHQQQTDDQIRQQLFAYSALEFQKEYTYMAEKKLDLDGLDLDTAMHLFQLHWNHHHLGFLMTYRPAVMHSLATGGPHCNKLLLNAIYYTAALQSSREYMRDDPAHPEFMGTKFFLRFQSLFATEIQTSTTASIAALVSMGSSCVSNGRQTIGWLYAGLGYRMIVDLGLHIDPDKVQMSSIVPTKSGIILTEVDREIQRRYTWGAYINDRFQSLYFGRPPSLRMIEGAETSQTLLDTYEELEMWRPYTDPQSSEKIPDFTPQPVRAISTWNALVRLAEITSEIIDRFYTPKACRLPTESAQGELQLVQRQLDLWAATLPIHMRYEPGELPVPPPIRFNLHTTFNLLHILLHRPFLREGHLEALGVDESPSRSICVSAALRIYSLAKTYREVFTLRRATYLFSYAIFSAATILPLHSTPDSNNQERLEIVKFFWNALKELQNGANFGLRKPIFIIKGMFERAGIDLNALATMHEQQHPVDHNNQQDHSLPFLPDSGLDALAHEYYREFYNDLSFGNIDWPAFINDIGEEQDDKLPLYGLFRPGADDFGAEGHLFSLDPVLMQT